MFTIDLVLQDAIILHLPQRTHERTTPVAWQITAKGI